jgi:DNA primase
MALDLLEMLDAAGVSQLREGLSEIHGACPGHFDRVGHVDRHPSWSINKTKLTHLCFSCGYKGTLTQLLTDITGLPPDEGLELQIKQDSFLRRMADRMEDPAEIVAPLLDDWALQHILTDVPSRLLELRHLQRAAVDAYMVRWELERKCWVLPIRDPAGALLGAQYRQKGNVYTSPEGMQKNSTLFGYSTVSQEDHCALVESPLDAVRLYGMGIPAVASLGSWVSDAQARLLSRTYACVYLALDNDAAGKDGAQRIAPTIRKMGSSAVMWRYGDSKAKDIGDVEDDAEVWSMWQRTLSFGMG